MSPPITAHLDPVHVRLERRGQPPRVRRGHVAHVHVSAAEAWRQRGHAPRGVRPRRGLPEARQRRRGGVVDLEKSGFYHFSGINNIKTMTHEDQGKM